MTTCYSQHTAIWGFSGSAMTHSILRHGQVMRVKAMRDCSPTYARIYFDGCDVGDGEEGGGSFSAPRAVYFLKGMGGEVTTGFRLPSGWDFPPSFPSSGGTRSHPCGHIVKVRLAPGDTVGTLEY